MSQQMSNALKKLHRQFLALTRARGHFMKTSVVSKTRAESRCLNCSMVGHLNSQPDQELKEKFISGRSLTQDCYRPSRCADCNEVVHPKILTDNGGICNECKESRWKLNHARPAPIERGMDTWNNRLRVDPEEIDWRIGYEDSRENDE